MSEGEKLIFTVLMWLARRFVNDVFHHVDCCELDSDHRRLDKFEDQAQRLGWEKPWNW